MRTSVSLRLAKERLVHRLDVVADGFNLASVRREGEAVAGRGNNLLVEQRDAQQAGNDGPAGAPTPSAVAKVDPDRRKEVHALN